MKPTGFYKLTQNYFDIIKQIGGTYRDNKERPIYCCMHDKKCADIYWAIPTSDISHRASEQLERIKRLCVLPERDIRSCYYHLGHTNRPAIFRISSVLPVTDKYISSEYTSQGIHLELRNNKAGIAHRSARNPCREPEVNSVSLTRALPARRVVTRR